MNAYDHGATVRLSAEFTDPNDVLADPTTVTLKLERPDGTEQTLTDAVKDAVGKYHRDVLVTVSGTWHYRYEGTGAVAQVQEGRFLVKKTAFA